MSLVTNFRFLDVVIIVCGAILAVYAYFWHSYQYWKKRGFPSLSPSFPMGNFSGMGRKNNMDGLLTEMYNNHSDKPFFGAYMLQQPIVIVRDLDLVKNILVKDFSSFHDHMDKGMFQHDAMMRHNLFLMNGKEWRNLRIKLTPTFTSGKMKMMFPTFIEVGKELSQVWEEASGEKEVGIKDILARYTTDVIGSVAFGIEVNSLKNPESEFRKWGNKLTKHGVRQYFVGMIYMISPRLGNAFRLKFLSTQMTEFFETLFSETLEFRMKNNVKRKDFMDLLVQLITLGYIQDADHSDSDRIEGAQQHFTPEMGLAQAFSFFAAGFETSSSAMQFALYELALNPELQRKLQEELDEASAAVNEELTYDVIMHLDLLDRVVNETLRKYPFSGSLFRKCSQEYQIPGTDHKILEGEKVWLPVYAYHHDPKNFPDPEKFDPDRFLPEVKKTRHSFAYMPFGEGPRNCIGNRFALMQVKVGLAMTLQRFSVSPSRNTPIPIVFDLSANALVPKGLICLKITKREK